MMIEKLPLTLKLRARQAPKCQRFGTNLTSAEPETKKHGGSFRFFNDETRKSPNAQYYSGKKSLNISGENRQCAYGGLMT
jgi:hypothetical protein